MKKANAHLRAVAAMISLLMLSPVSVLAQGDQGPTVLGGPSKAGTVAAQFLQLGVSARATGMGESYVALVNDVSAAFYNAAALAELTTTQAMFNHTTLPGGLRHYFATVAHPFTNLGTLALSFNILTTGDMPVTVAFQGPTGETFSASESAIGVSYAKPLTDRFAVGGTAKLIFEDLAGFNERAVAFDIGTLYHTGFRELTIGMSVANFGPDLDFGIEKDSQGNVIFDGQSFQLPITFRFGVYLDIVNQSESKFIVAGQLVQPNDNLRYETLGVEYSWRDAIFLRGGLKIDEESDRDILGETNGFSENFSAGAGVKASLEGFVGQFDVSWVNQENLNNLIRFSALLSF